MMTYRLYYCDRDDRVTHFVTLDADDDLGAIDQGRALPHRYNKEVWAGACRLTVIAGVAEAVDAGAEADWRIGRAA